MALTEKHGRIVPAVVARPGLILSTVTSEVTRFGPELAVDTHLSTAVARVVS